MRGAGRVRAGFAAGLAAALGAALVLTGTGWTQRADADTATTWTAGQLRFVPLTGTTLGADRVGSYRGTLEVGPDGSGIGVVNVAGLEDYVLGISEVPPNWPTAALEAQAIAARTYAVWSMLTHRPAGGLDPQICASDDCQVYRGMTRDAEPGDAAWVAAVRATAGQVLMYGNNVIEAVYGSSDGGQTTYGGVPWLPAISDPDDAVSPEHQWSWSAPLSDLAAPLGVPDGWSITGLATRGNNVEVDLSADDNTGRTVTDTLGSGRFHYLLNTRMGAPGGLPLPLPSWRFQVSTSGSDAVVRGWGFGNGMGLSQYGALGKAERGWSAGQILAAYYGPARSVRLGSNQIPQMIRVAVADGLSAATVRASGPFLLEDGAGRVLASGTAGAWSVTSAAGGVEVSAPSGFQPPAAPTPPPTTPVTAPAPTTAALTATAQPAATRNAEAAGPAGLAVPGRGPDVPGLLLRGLAVLAVLSTAGAAVARLRYLRRVPARSSISQA